MQNKEVYTNLCTGSQGRAPNPISLHPVFLILRWYWGSASIAGNNACFTMYNTLWLYGEHLYYRMVFYKKIMECFIPTVTMMFLFSMHPKRDTGTRWGYNILCVVKYQREWWRNTGEKGCFCRFETSLAKCSCSLYHFSFIHWYDQLIFIATAVKVILVVKYFLTQALEASLNC